MQKCYSRHHMSKIANRKWLFSILILLRLLMGGARVRVQGQLPPMPFLLPFLCPYIQFRNCGVFLTRKRRPCEARHYNPSLYVCLPVTLVTLESRLNGLRWRNTICTTRERDVSSFLGPNFTVPNLSVNPQPAR